MQYKVKQNGATVSDMKCWMVLSEKWLNNSITFFFQISKQIFIYFVSTRVVDDTQQQENTFAIGFYDT